MAQQGWVKIHRKLRECYLWKDKEPFDKRSAWIDLLLSTNHADNKTIINNKVETILRGTFITSEVKLSERWKWDRGKVRRFLKLLESDNMIKKVATARLYITIEIINYDEYQNKESATSETLDITKAKDINTTSNEQVANKSRTSSEHKQECLKNEKKLFLSDSNEYRLAEYLKKHILLKNPTCKVPDDKKIQSWCRTIDLMLRVDNRNADDIKKHIEYIRTDTFWCNKILSADKFRIQYDLLTGQMNKSKEVIKPKQTQTYPTCKTV